MYVTREQMIQKFKFDMIRELPFYGDIILRLPFVEDKSIPTACTDGYTIKYNPHFLGTLSEKQSNFVLMHEVFHVLLRHNVRGIGKNHDAWNTACDLVVNSEILKLMSSDYNVYNKYFERPAKGIFSNDITSADTAENLYAKIMNRNEKCKNGIPFRVNEEIMVPGKKNYRDGEYPFPCNPDLLAPSEEANITLPEILKEVLAAEKSRSDQASYYVPAQIRTLLLKKQVNWKTILKDFLTEEADGEASYITPERKYIHMDLILPGHCKEPGDIGTVWMFIDSSGSINSDEITSFLSEGRILCKEFGATLNICFWDTSVTDIYRNIDKEKDVADCIPHHSGGTNINCVYKWLVENKEHPECIIVLTDGFFGTLQVTDSIKKFLKNTVMVLSVKDKLTDPQMKFFGKRTCLGE